MTLEAAEAAREEQGAAALDENELGELEEDVRDLGILLKKATVKVTVNSLVCINSI